MTNARNYSTAEYACSPSDLDEARGYLYFKLPSSIGDPPGIREVCVTIELSGYNRGEVHVMPERGLVDVEIVRKGDGTGTHDGGGLGEVRVRTTNGDLVWVPEKDVIARKPEEKA